MNVGELQLALLPYPTALPVVVVFAPQEDRDYRIESVDDVRDDQSGKRYVIIACIESA